MPTTLHPTASDAGRRTHPYPQHIPGAAPQPPRGKGGSFSTMFASMSIVAAGLLGFYFAQFKIQGKRNPSEVKNLTEVPTWQLRHAQQQPGAVPELPKKGDAELYTRQTPDFEPRPGNLPRPGNSVQTSGIRGIIEEAVTSSSGKGSEATQKHSDHVAEPSHPKRMNDAGKTYTKNPDYTDSFKKAQ